MPYTVTPTALPEVLILEPKVFGDARGFFFESFNQRVGSEKFVFCSFKRRCNAVLCPLKGQ